MGKFIRALVLLSGPFSSSLGCDAALREIGEFCKQLNALKEEESSVLKDLSFFEIDQPPFRAIRLLEKVRPALSSSSTIGITFITRITSLCFVLVVDALCRISTACRRSGR